MITNYDAISADNLHSLTEEVCRKIAEDRWQPLGPVTTGHMRYDEKNYCEYIQVLVMYDRTDP